MTSDAACPRQPEALPEAPSLRPQPPLAGVGMDGIDVALLVPGADGMPWRLPAKVQISVNLVDPNARGIHMSRLYRILDQVFGAHPLGVASLRSALTQCLESQQGLATEVRLGLRYDLLLRRPALLSDSHGTKRYPIRVLARLAGGELTLELQSSVSYSSTCPCSAALARQLIQQQFDRDLPGELSREALRAWLGSEAGIVATPHGQRSAAEFRLKLLPAFEQLPVVDFIDRVEAALVTVTQTAVRREDEQAFARLNGANLMFCEDAARRVHAALDADPRILDFWARNAHYESLHPHDAVAVSTKGVRGGYAADFGALNW